MIYWKADTDRLHVKRIERERGLLQIEATYKAWLTFRHLMLTIVDIPHR